MRVLTETRFIEPTIMLWDNTKKQMQPDELDSLWNESDLHRGLTKDTDRDAWIMTDKQWEIYRRNFEYEVQNANSKSYYIGDLLDGLSTVHIKNGDRWLFSAKEEKRDDYMSEEKKMLKYILQRLGCGNPFLPKVIYDEYHNVKECFTKDGSDTYSRLTEILEDVGQITMINMEDVIETLDCIAFEIDG